VLEEKRITLVTDLPTTSRTRHGENFSVSCLENKIDYHIGRSEELENKKHEIKRLKDLNERG